MAADCSTPASYGRHNCRTECGRLPGPCGVHRVTVGAVRTSFRAIIVNAFEDKDATVPGGRIAPIVRLAEAARVSMLPPDGTTPLDQQPHSIVEKWTQIGLYGRKA